MDKKELEKTLIELIAVQMGIDASKITMTSHLMNDLATDSIDDLKISTAIEDKLKIQMSDKDFEKLNTVNDVFNYLDTRLNPPGCRCE